jgi:hypothetical protein
VFCFAAHVTRLPALSIRVKNCSSSTISPLWGLAVSPLPLGSIVPYSLLEAPSVPRWKASSGALPSLALETKL